MDKVKHRNCCISSISNFDFLALRVIIGIPAATLQQLSPESRSHEPTDPTTPGVAWRRVHLRRSPLQKVFALQVIADEQHRSPVKLWSNIFILNQGGPQSVCLALAACCFAKNALPKFWGRRGLEILDAHQGDPRMLPAIFSITFIVHCHLKNVDNIPIVKIGQW